MCKKHTEKTMEECGATNTNTDVIPDVAGVIEETRKLLGMSQHDFSVKRTLLNGFEYEGKNPSRETLKTLVNDMVGKLRLLQSFEEVDESELTWSVVDDYRQFASLTQSEVAEEMNLTQTGYGYRVNNKGDEGGQQTVQAFESMQERIEDDLHQAHENLIRLESLAWGDIRWVKVDSVERTSDDNVEIVFETGQDGKRVRRFDLDSALLGSMLEYKGLDNPRRLEGEKFVTVEDSFSRLDIVIPCNVSSFGKIRYKLFSLVEGVRRPTKISSVGEDLVVPTVFCSLLFMFASGMLLDLASSAEGTSGVVRTVAAVPGFLGVVALSCLITYGVYRMGLGLLSEQLDGDFEEKRLWD